MYVIVPELPEARWSIENALIELMMKTMFLVVVIFGDGAFVCLGIRIFRCCSACSFLLILLESK
jgi:hypothetical protein